MKLDSPIDLSSNWLSFVSSFSYFFPYFILIFLHSDTCPATEHPMISGLDSLTNRTCWGNFGYNEDKKNYGEQWNYSQNLSWQYYDSSETGSKTRFGYVYTYGGGGYVQELGTTYNDTLDKLKELQTKNWIDERYD